MLNVRTDTKTYDLEYLNMRKGKKINYKTSKKSFTKTASRTHPKNMRAAPMRGGIRL